MRYYVSWKTTGYYRKHNLKLAARCPISGCWPSCICKSRTYSSLSVSFSRDKRSVSHYTTYSLRNCWPNILCDILGDMPHILDNIVRLKSDLANVIEPDFGLLDQLLRLEVLDRRQYDDIRSEKGAAYRRSEAVLDLLETEDQCVKLLKALQRTGQQHVVNVITQNGGQKFYDVQNSMSLKSG